ncbi:hypothetical protein ABI59_11700 [Acidobacteria bacterium Mor1]|nr:hypothetical protein ABI59_11700 [Acidobacteria bacterium Mor1]
MKKALIATMLGMALLALTAAPAISGDARTLKGEYVWNAMDGGGPLEAVFTPTGEGQWQVDFNFSFRGEDHTYSGTAEGALGSGTLKGEVMNESKKRTFTFEGSFEDGTFSGTHAETTPGRARDTGTLTLSL